MSLIGCMLSHSVCFLADDLAESTDHLWFSICVAPFYMLYILNIAELLISSEFFYISSVYADTVQI